ncbi:bifunctional biotin--[acetyl-CoA-carboxylase] ligase/biotin operon repressor BirA [Agarivorans gilvus]|uniref:Bifunctional ligase/repressor BirA n=1 Tax=Agarivorans gilvus TaxID=680279 RepID=A0ABQ1I1T9_9ALTE|nr:bifunctional biotin--[acetyl-CoA-carboxylase] ligase/biotin operon repressor BirA [Agarivorans gilvus]GGB06872.1 bifunctional ligase/repressor BirA [Agarivorans gilvus]
MRANKPYQLLKHIADGQFYSGESLAQALGVSRTTIASYIKHYSELGLDIYKVKGKGYRLAKPLSLLDNEQLAASLAENSLQVFEQLDSTNAWLMQHQQQLDHGQVVLAEYQSAGRGRRGRQWQTPYAGQLCMSMLWRLQDGIEATMGLSLAVGLAVVESLEKLGYSGLALKWPNDIYMHGAKLGGVLIELQGQSDSEVSLVMGMGLNVRVEQQQASLIDQKFAQLELDGEVVDRNQLAVTLIQALNQMFEQFSSHGFAKLQQRWNHYDVFSGQQVSLHFSQDKQVSGIAKGVDQQGQLLLEIDGVEQRFMAGEVSLRGQ